MMQKPLAVKYVLAVQDMSRAVSFYQEVIGFTAASVSPFWSELRFGDVILGLHGGGDGVEKRTGLSIQYEDVGAVFELAVRSGARAIQAPEEREGEPILLAAIADPEGNVIALTQITGVEI